MPGEMLPRREHSMILHAAHERGSKLRRQSRVLTERTGANNRVGWIVIDIEHRPEAHMNSECSPLECRYATDLVRERGISRRPERHLQREDSGAAQVDRVGYEVPTTHAEAGPCLEIRAE